MENIITSQEYRDCLDTYIDIVDQIDRVEDDMTLEDEYRLRLLHRLYSKKISLSRTIKTYGNNVNVS